MNLYRPQENNALEHLSGLVDNEIKCQTVLYELNLKIETNDEYKTEYEAQLLCKKLLQSIEPYTPTPFLTTRIMAVVRSEAKSLKKQKFLSWVPSIKRIAVGVAASVALFVIGTLSYNWHTSLTTAKLAKNIPSNVYKSLDDPSNENPQEFAVSHNVSFSVQPIGYEVEPEQYLIDLHSRSEAENKAESK